VLGSSSGDARACTTDTHGLPIRMHSRYALTPPDSLHLSRRMPCAWIQAGSVVINVAAQPNVCEDAIRQVPGVRYVPKIGTHRPSPTLSPTPRLHYRLLTLCPAAPRPTDPVPRGQLWPTGPIYSLQAVYLNAQPRARARAPPKTRFQTYFPLPPLVNYTTPLPPIPLGSLPPSHFPPPPPAYPSRPSGRMTVAMLQRNLVRLIDNFHLPR